MKILGANKMLSEPGPNIVLEMDSKHTLETLKRPLDLEMFSGWYGNNVAQVYWDEEDNEFCLMDINVVGDADPWNTLWYVFDESELKTLFPEIDFTEMLKITKKEFEKGPYDNQWAKDILKRYDWDPIFDTDMRSDI